VADLDPAELTEPLDVVAWLRALSVGTVLLDGREPPRVWQVRLRCSDYHDRLQEREFAALVMGGSEEFYELGDDEDAGMVAAEGPFRVLYVPPEGGV
jgi:hypothetical protein